MSNLRFTATEIISQLQQLLREQYRGDDGELTILKEIVQNADDAGASTLRFILMETGITETRNPLLGGPALVCINDGSFTRENERAIRTMAGTSKAENPASVGRFGVGQKSVFHLVEAYFYLGRSPGDGRPRADVINPWSEGDDEDGDLSYREWDNFDEQDQLRVLDSVKPWIVGDRWFVLYLPLRLPEHERASAGVIYPHYPDIQKLTESLERMSELGYLLPQLGHLREIFASRIDPSARVQTLGSACWRSQGPGLSRPGPATPPQSSFEVDIEVTGANGESTLLHATGEERCVQDMRLTALQSHKQWPQRKIRREKAIVSVPEKAIAHGAVTVIREPASRGAALAHPVSLQLGWAVFLPLAAPFECVNVPGGTINWRILLHGYSFPDSGRQTVHGLDDASSGTAVSDEPSREDHVRVRWNRLVRDLETLRCLLPAVRRASVQVPPVEGEALGKALARSLIFEKNRAAAGAEWSLVWGPSSSGTVAKWLPSSTRLLPLPRPAGDENAAAAGLLACLLRVERSGVAIVWDDSPRLCERSSWHPWQQDDVRVALAEGLETGLNDPSALRYIVRCIETIRATYSPVERHLADLLRRVLQKKVPLSSEAIRSAWRDVTALCSPADILWSSAGLALVREIAGMSPPTTILVLPTDLRPVSWAAMFLPALLPADAVSLLRFVAARVSGDKDDAAQRVASEVVAAFGASNVLQNPAISELRVFRVWSVLHGNTCLTAERLIALRGDHRAYRDAGAFAPPQVARTLRDALADLTEDVVLASEDLAIAFDLVELSQPAIALLFAADCPSLGPATARAAVVELLTSGGGHFRTTKPVRERTNAALRRALRTLIHGDSHRAGDEESLLYVATTHSEMPTELIARLFRAMGSEWRLVPAGMIRDLDWMGALGIVQLTRQSLIRLLGDAPGRWRDDIGGLLSKGERAALRELIVAEKDEALFRALRIHDAGGSVVNVGDPDVFLAGQQEVPVALSGYVKLVRPDETSLFQERCFRQWSPSAQLELCIALANPVRYMSEILDAIADLPGDRSAVNHESERDLLQKVRETPWVLVLHHGPVCPSDVYVLPLPVLEAIRLLLPQGTRAYCAPHELDDQMKTHRGFKRFLDGFAMNGDEAMEAAALEIEESWRKHTSKPVLQREDGARRLRLLEVGATIHALHSDPTWRLVGVLRQEYGEMWHGRGGALLGALCADLTEDRLIDLLSRLAAAEPRSENLLELFDYYLTVAARRTSFKTSILPKIKLLDEEKAWRKPDELTRWGANLQPRHRLDDRHAQILGYSSVSPESLKDESRPADIRPPPSNAEIERAAEVLDRYLAPWRERVSEEALGHFAAIFGEGAGKSIDELCERLLTGRTLEGARECYFRTFTTFGVASERGVAMNARYGFEIVADGQEIGVESLVGSRFSATVSKARANSLFVGRPPSGKSGGWVRLRQVDVRARSLDDLSNLLRNGVVTFLEQAVGVSLTADKFAEYWLSLTHGGRSQVEVVRGMILDDLPGYVQTLVGQSDALLREPLRRIQRAKQRVQEMKAVGILLDDRRRAGDELDAARCALQELVERNTEVQSHLVAAVRVKIVDHRYQADQVLFELFQNADDAAAQLMAMRRPTVARPDGAGGDEPLLRFRVETQAPTRGIRVQHWGRAINQHEAGIPFPPGRERGYDLDLHHMTVLHLSEKNRDSTGRFGLGFKSVYLLADRPKIKSGSLSFEIVGGILPAYYPAEGAERIDGTTIDLTLRDGVEVADALLRFQQIGGLLPVFSQVIRHVVLGAGLGAQSRWEPRPVEGVPGVEVGEACIDLSGSATSRRLLVMRGGDTGPRHAVAFALGKEGVGELSADIPTIWCTTPTLERWRTGFIINGPFALSTGRGQLAHENSENGVVMRTLGAVLGSALVSLFGVLDDSAHFARTAEQLGVGHVDKSPDDVKRDFWTRMFERLVAPFTRTEHSTDDVMKSLRQLHGHGAGLSVLLRNAAALPTGLSGEHEVLTHLRDVRWVLDPIVANKKIFEKLVQLLWVTSKMPAGSALADHMWAPLRQLGIAPESAPVELGLGLILAKALPDDVAVKVEDARALSGIDAILGRLDTRELEALEERVVRWRFFARVGAPRLGRELLIDESFRAQIDKLDADRRAGLQDELLRSRFAPRTHLLDVRYATDVGVLAFFLFARQRLAADAATLAAWAFQATDPDTRRSVVFYLSRGELAPRVATELADKLGFWGRDKALVATLGADAGLTAWEVSALLTILLRKEAIDDEPEDEDESPSSAPGAFPVSGMHRGVASEALCQIAEWWKTRRSHWVPQYESEVYPVGWKRDVFTAALKNRDREAWMTLLVLGAGQRFGRQTTAQHRGFIKHLQGNGNPRWWKVICSGTAGIGPREWIQILDEWLKSIVQNEDDIYRLWLGLYPMLYQLHRYLDVYIDLLVRAPSRDAESFFLDRLLSPRSDHEVRGAPELDAPPLARSIGIGRVWVLRELTRLGVIEADHLRPFCYVPRYRTRELLTWLGAKGLDDARAPALHAARSRQIHVFLLETMRDDVEVTFMNDFDLPLYLIATDAFARKECRLDDLKGWSWIAS